MLNPNGLQLVKMLSYIGIKISIYKRIKSGEKILGSQYNSPGGTIKRQTTQAKKYC